MTPEEFERLKNEEKAHLRQLRQLKQTHRDAQRKASTLDALGKMRNAQLESDIDAGTEQLLRGAALSEARFELALEGQAPQTNEAVDAEALAKAEAEALVRQMKAQMGGGAERTTSEEAARASASPSAPAEAKTIGKTPPAEDAPPAVDKGAKTIGRHRDT